MEITTVNTERTKQKTDSAVEERKGINSEKLALFDLILKVFLQKPTAMVMENKKREKYSDEDWEKEENEYIERDARRRRRSLKK